MQIKTKLIIIITLSISPYAMASSGFPAPATEFTQILNNIQLLQQSFNQVEMIYQKAQSIAHQIEQLKSIATYDQSAWPKAQSLLRQLNSIIWEVEGTVYTYRNLDEQFKRIYKEYEPVVNYAQEYRDWHKNTMGAIKNSLKAANFQTSEMQSEEAVMNKLFSLSDSSVGQTQAIQVGNKISGEVVNQIQLLRSLVASQIQAQSTHMAEEKIEEERAYSTAQTFFGVIPEQRNE